MGDSSRQKSNRFKGLMTVIRQTQDDEPVQSFKDIPPPIKPQEDIPIKALEVPDIPEIIWVEHSKIHRDPEQSRRYFDPTEIRNMAASIQAVGILDPLSVRPRPSGNEYDLLAGEKRHRSAELAGLSKVPVRVFVVDDRTAEDIKAISNLQRGDLNKWEETNAIMGMLCRNLGKNLDEVVKLLNQAANQKRGLTDNVVRNEEWEIVEDVFALVGRLTPESFRKHRVPLLKLPAPIQEILQQGKLSYTKVNEALKVKDPEQQSQLLEEAITHDLSVDQIQAKVKQLRQNAPKLETASPPLTIPERMTQLTRQVKRSKAWQNPQRQKQITDLLNKIEHLLND